MEPLSAVFWVFGLLLIVGSWLLLLIESFDEDYTWGLATLFVPPLSYLYALFTLDKTKDVIIMAVIGWALIFLGWQ